MAFEAANLSPVVEKQNLIVDSNSRHGDMFLSSRTSGQSAVLDVTVTSTAETSGYATEAAEDQKFKVYEQK